MMKSKGWVCFMVGGGEGVCQARTVLCCLSINRHGRWRSGRGRRELIVVGKWISNPIEAATQNIETIKMTCPIPDLF